MSWIKIMLEDKAVYEHYSGYANKEKQIPIEADTLYRIYSMTKPVTVTAALQLYEQGKFLFHHFAANFPSKFRQISISVP